MGRMKEALLGDTPYPLAPGFKERGGASEQAAAEIKPAAATLREQVLAAIRISPATADEVAERLRVSILAIRPRLSELRAQGKIEPTGERRENASGKYATVWTGT